MAEKICAVYKITNTITGDFYIGSSKNVKQRWTEHKCKSSWNEQPNNPMYQDMQKYGLNKFSFQILEEVEPEKLKEIEQQFIDSLKPTYNSNNANGLNVGKIKEYRKTHKEEIKQYQKEYQKTERARESQKKSRNKYNNQLCFYNGEMLKLHTLFTRFSRAGIPHPTLEAKKYLLQ